MSSSDRLLLILHIGFAIFTLGPLTAATMSTPRYIRKRDITIVRYLNRTTAIYAFGSLGVFLFGLFLAEGKFAKFWLSASMTLFIVALLLLFIVERDQRKALRLLEAAAGTPAGAEAASAAAPDAASQAKDEAGEKTKKKDKGEDGASGAQGDVAAVERGRIAAFSGVIALLWIVILIMMVWH
ncbi:hypothetical protein [Actinomadura harenae]|uniref:DUF2269 family protein n=1 Tax=Actinomadura harenae TaxID=2483351 RepID=A0A3M2M4Z2_9ACTN|nr:hypothetical protein [Actinomadura harenae]RMI44542.1 hypothetical protein EBO15_12990 [Actinomadura harenae]